MLTSTEDAQTCVTSLKSRIPRNTSTLIGHYRLHDDRVSLILKKQDTKINIIAGNNRRRNREVSHDSGEQSFHAVSETHYIFKI